MMGKRALLFKDADTGEIECISLEIEEEDALPLLNAVDAFQRLAKEYLQDRNVVWACFGDEWVVEPEAP